MSMNKCSRLVIMLLSVKKLVTHPYDRGWKRCVLTAGVITCLSADSCLLVRRLQFTDQTDTSQTDESGISGLITCFSLAQLSYVTHIFSGCFFLVRRETLKPMFFLTVLCIEDVKYKECLQKLCMYASCTDPRNLTIFRVALSCWQPLPMLYKRD